MKSSLLTNGFEIDAENGILIGSYGLANELAKYSMPYITQLVDFLEKEGDIGLKYFKSREEILKDLSRGFWKFPNGNYDTISSIGYTFDKMADIFKELYRRDAVSIDLLKEFSLLLGDIIEAQGGVNMGHYLEKRRIDDYINGLEDSLVQRNLIEA